MKKNQSKKERELAFQVVIVVILSLGVFYWVLRGLQAG